MVLPKNIKASFQCQKQDDINKIVFWNGRLFVNGAEHNPANLYGTPKYGYRLMLNVPTAAGGTKEIDLGLVCKDYGSDINNFYLKFTCHREDKTSFTVTINHGKVIISGNCDSKVIIKDAEYDFSNLYGTIKLGYRLMLNVPADNGGTEEIDLGLVNAIIDATFE